MPLNAFIVRPFGVKELVVTDRAVVERLQKSAVKAGANSVLRRLEPIADGAHWIVAIDFDAVDQRLIVPVLERLSIHGEAASAVVVAGNIREDMFHRLLTADVVIADLSIHNPNVFYELGIRQAFRDKYTFLVRSNLSEYPFDLKTDRYFEYDLVDLVEHSEQTIDRLTKALRATISSYKADSPVFKLLPKLQAEDRSRFIAVPDEFREEVERARRHRRPEHLRLLAVECAGFLWEAEGLRAVGRAQFESNFIDGAKVTWEEIVNRYPDDVEANTVLSTVYQRLNDATRSEQALARVSRSSSLSASRFAQLRSLNGRNLKEAWTQQWRASQELPERQVAALTSPLLQRAYDAYEEAFMADLNNAYAGLNALTLLVVQTELAQKLPEVWRGIQRRPEDAEGEVQARKARIRQLIAALELAVESDRERLRREGSCDVWFGLLEAAVACIVSDQPEHVAQLYESARHSAPMNAEQSMRRALEIYRDLDIRGRNFTSGCEIGTVGANIDRALGILSCQAAVEQQSDGLKRILMFVGLRLDHTITGSWMPADGGANPQRKSRRLGFCEDCVDETRAAIDQAIQEEAALGGNILFGLAAGANGGDLLFHEACRDLHIPTRLCLALPRAQYVGQYVAPAGRHWVEKFSTIYRHVRESANIDGAHPPGITEPVTVFTDANELPRWLQGKPYYNAGRRNNLWMLQHAIIAANRFDDNAEITLLALWDGEQEGEVGTGGIGHLVKLAAASGIKVHRIVPPQRKVAAEQKIHALSAAAVG